MSSSASSTTAAANRYFVHGGGPTLEGVANLIKHPRTKNIVVLTGAGISTSASPPIPDFRSKRTGLYDNLAKYNLPYPEAIFDIDYFQSKPEAFYTLARELYPGNFKPSLAHYFFRLLHEKGKLLRVFTQNVDTLERIAGLPAERIVEAHGSFATAACIRCRKSVSPSWIKERVQRGEIARCPASKCKSGLVKPDIVFFGEGLPSRFFQRMSDLEQADLLLVLGTSLQVQPFASLIDAVGARCPRVLINLERVGELAAYEGGHVSMRGLMNESGFDFAGSTHGGAQLTRDVFWRGKADDGVAKLAEHLGWKDELLKLKQDAFKMLEKEWGHNKDTAQPEDLERATTAPAPAEAQEKKRDGAQDTAADSLADTLASTTISERDKS